MHEKDIENRLLERWVSTIIWIVFLISTGVIIFATLSPFKFSLFQQVNAFRLISTRSISELKYDFLRNIILFIPFTFILSLLISTLFNRAKNLSKNMILASISLSLCVECLQLYLPQRTPTLFDLIANSLGGYFGFLLFSLCGSVALKMIYFCADKSMIIFSRRKYIKLMMFGYIGFSFVLILLINAATSLGNWDANLPLVIGNELTGDRPWSGHISELYILNKKLNSDQVETFLQSPNKSSLFPKSLLLAADFTESTDYKYVAKKLPILKWSNTDNQVQDKDKGISLSSDNWLSTESSVKPLTNAIKKSSQLSVIANISTSDLQQFGPARIMSLSKSPNSRNITLGQKGNDFVVRIRTPFTEENGSRPSIVFPNIFLDERNHYLIYTYGGKISNLYVDNKDSQYSVEFNPGSVVLWSLLNGIPHFPMFTSNMIYPNTDLTNWLNILLYFLFFIPIILLLSFFVGASK